MAGEYVTHDQLAEALDVLDKKQRSRLYTVKGELIGRIDTMEEGLREDMNKMEARILAEMRNGHHPPK